MKGKKIIIVETLQKTVIRRVSARPEIVRCEFCAAEVEMLSPARAADLTGKTERIIYRQVETGRLHFIETSDGKLLICSNSLSKLS